MAASPTQPSVLTLLLGVVLLVAGVASFTFRERLVALKGLDEYDRELGKGCAVTVTSVFLPLFAVLFGIVFLISSAVYLIQH